VHSSLATYIMLRTHTPSFFFAAIWYYVLLHILLLNSVYLYGQSTISNDSLLAKQYLQAGQKHYTNKALQKANIAFYQAQYYYQKLQLWDYYVISITKNAKVYIKAKQVISAWQSIDSLEHKYLDVNEEIREQVSVATLAELYRVKAIALDRSGKYVQALKYYHQALHYFEGSSEQAKKLSSTYKSIGNIYSRQSNYATAIIYLDKAIAIEKNIGRSEKLIDRYIDIIIAHSYLNNLEKVHHYYDSALQNPAVSIQQQIMLHNNVLDVYINNKQYEKALEIATTALTLAQHHFPLKHRTISVLHQSIAQIYAAQNQYNKAGKHAEHAITTIKQVYPNKHRARARVHLIQGDILCKKKQFSEALQHFQQILIEVISGFNDTHTIVNPPITAFYPEPFIATALYKKARTLVLLYEKDTSSLFVLEQALNCYTLAIQARILLRQSAKNQDSKTDIGTDSHMYYEEAIETALQLYQQTHKQVYLEQAFIFCEQSKAGALRDALKNIEYLNKAKVPDSLLHKRRTLQQKIAHLKVIIHNNHAYTHLFKDSLFYYERQHQKLLEQLQRNYPNYTYFHSSLPDINIAEIQRSFLKTQTQILSYFWGQKRLYAFSLSTQHLQVHSIDISPDFIQQLQILRKYLQQRPDTLSNKQAHYQQYIEQAHALYCTIIAPVITSPSPNHPTPELFIIPDGDLGYIPFEVLLTQLPSAHTFIRYEATQLPYLINTHVISYAYSLSLLLKAEQTASKPYTQHFAAFAPIFATQTQSYPNTIQEMCNSGQTQLSPLPFSKHTVQQLQQLLKGHSFIAEQATKEHFLQTATQAQIIHFDTHACFSANNPLQNAIFLADEALYTHEIYHIPLQSDLVVLNACETGLGKWQRGEGIMSLARGFLYAGCPSTITSLWRVNDFTSAQIIQTFYKYLHQGMPKHLALHKAKIHFLSKGQGQYNQYAAPYYWASFIHIGKRQALVSLPLTSHVMYYCFIALLLFAFVLLLKKANKQAL